jgi:hypothetical protein
VEHVLILRYGAGHGIKVLAAGGIDEVVPSVKAVERALTPLSTSDSPYASSTVALVDGPNEFNRGTVEEIGRVLGDRLVVLPDSSLEEYLPDGLYERAGREKAQVLRDVAGAREDYGRLRRLKGEVADAIRAVLTAEDLELLPDLKRAVDLAVERST